METHAQASYVTQISPAACREYEQYRHILENGCPVLTSWTQVRNSLVLSFLNWDTTSTIIPSQTDEQNICYGNKMTV